MLAGERRDILKVMNPEELPHAPRGVSATTVKEYVEISRFSTVTMVVMRSTEEKEQSTELFSDHLSWSRFILKSVFSCQCCKFCFQFTIVFTCC